MQQEESFGASFTVSVFVDDFQLPGRGVFRPCHHCAQFVIVVEGDGDFAECFQRDFPRALEMFDGRSRHSRLFGDGFSGEAFVEAATAAVGGKALKEEVGVLGIVV